jgi:Protein of unknown function (DUF3987)
MTDNKLYVPPFPIGVFPPNMQKYIFDTARTMPCPEDFIGVGVLAVLSACIGSSRRALIKQDWSEPTILFSVIVGRPSSKKTPALNKTKQPLEQIQKVMAEEFREKKTAYQKDKENLEMPKFQQIITSDATMEALSSVLQTNKRGVMVFQDEISGFLKGMNQYKSGGGNDSEKLMKLYNGLMEIINRKSMDEPLYLEKPHITILGGTQPDCLPLFGTKAHNGFINRFLFSYPEPVEDEFITESVQPEVLDYYAQLCKSLYALKHNEDQSALVLPFTAEAQAIFGLYYNKLAADAKVSDTLMEATLGKMQGYTIRFALVLQLAHAPESTEISTQSVEYAIVLSEYFIQHARKVYASINGGLLDDKVVVLVRYVRDNGGSVNLRTLYTQKIAGCTNPETAKALCLNAQEQGLGKLAEQKNSTGGKPTSIFTLNNFKNVAAISNQNDENVKP